MFNLLKRIFSREARIRARWEVRWPDTDLSKFAVCLYCDEPIRPMDFIGRGYVLWSTEPKLVHAGYHNTATEKDALCETRGIGQGYWDGEKIIYSHESTVSEVMRTGHNTSAKY